jgi:hypothetical protein
MLRDIIETLPSDMKITEAVNEVKRELSGLINQIKEKDQHLHEERKHVQALQRELGESSMEIEKLVTFPNLTSHFRCMRQRSMISAKRIENSNIQVQFHRSGVD